MPFAIDSRGAFAIAPAKSIDTSVVVSITLNASEAETGTTGAFIAAKATEAGSNVTPMIAVDVTGRLGGGPTLAMGELSVDEPAPEPHPASLKKVTIEAIAKNILLSWSMARNARDR